MYRNHIYVNSKRQKTGSQEAIVFLTDDFSEYATQNMGISENRSSRKHIYVIDTMWFTYTSDWPLGDARAGPDKNQVFLRCDLLRAFQDQVYRGYGL